MLLVHPNHQTGLPVTLNLNGLSLSPLEALLSPATSLKRKTNTVPCGKKLLKLTVQLQVELFTVLLKATNTNSALLL